MTDFVIGRLGKLKLAQATGETVYVPASAAWGGDPSLYIEARIMRLNNNGSARVTFPRDTCLASRDVPTSAIVFDIPEYGHTPTRERATH